MRKRSTRMLVCTGCDSRMCVSCRRGRRAGDSAQVNPTLEMPHRESSSSKPDDEHESGRQDEPATGSCRDEVQAVNSVAKTDPYQIEYECPGTQSDVSRLHQCEDASNCSSERLEGEQVDHQ